MSVVSPYPSLSLSRPFFSGKKPKNVFIIRSFYARVFLSRDTILGYRLIGDWPNTYAFTKAIEENTVLRYGHKMPVCIVRPSIVTSTWKEPIAGWADSIYGPVGLLAGSSLGLLRTIHCHIDKKFDFVPADYVTSCLIAAAWQTSVR